MSFHSWQYRIRRATSALCDIRAESDVMRHRVMTLVCSGLGFVTIDGILLSSLIIIDIWKSRD